MDRNRFISLPGATFGVVTSIVVMLMYLTSCSERLAVPPERTVEVFYKGLRDGDKSLVSSTMIGDDGSNLSLGINREYEIVEKRLVLESNIGSKPSDVQIVTHTTVYWPQGPVVMVTTFILRKVGEEWKIAELYSEHGGNGV